MSDNIKKHHVTEEQVKMRLDQFLQTHVEGHSRSYIQKLIKDGSIRVNNTICNKKHYSLKEDDIVEISIPENKKLDLKPENIPLKIIYEDDDYLVINKPPNMVVHPSAQSQEGTLVNALLAYCKDSLSGIGGVERPGIVHRLDKDTSGLLIIAKNDFAHAYFSELFAKKTIKKTYLALVKNAMPSESGTIDSPIARRHTDRKKMGISIQGKPAVTHYKQIKNYNNCTFIEVKIETGRTHQIRVHVSSLQHPIIGDVTYGDPKINKKFKQEHNLQRMFLHAHKLEFIPPRKKEVQTFVAELPNDLQKALDSLDTKKAA
jgi:23S rRNA pseudouridine1911/1915/1917 synthase